MPNDKCLHFAAAQTAGTLGQKDIGQFLAAV